ncbi:MAG: nucleoside deaminase [Pseudomonadota bacterium]
MEIAFEEAVLAGNRGEVPVGAVIVCGDQILSRAGNRTLELHDPSAHAEVLAIRQACKLTKSERLVGCDLYVTLEPCPMCAATISFARIRRVYFGASDPKSGGVENGVRFFSSPTCHHSPEVYPGIMENDCSKILKQFFAGKRNG